MSAFRTSHRRRTGSRRTTAGLLSLLAALSTAVLALPGSATAAPHTPTRHDVTAAAPTTAAGKGGVTHPRLDWLGSTVRAHEGGKAGNTPAPSLVAQTPGMDVSGYQGNVNWQAAWNNGGKFAYVKATESTTYTNPYFAQQYNGSYNVGMIRGAYHFATPNTSSGRTQADYFVNHGGGWSNDGKTLPPMLDIEYNPYGATCYGLSQSAMSQWIADFSNEVHARTGRYPTIYTTTDWWTTCTGNNPNFGANPLFIARYASSPGAMPASWGYQTIWQYADSGTYPGDQDYFNGALDRLQAFAH
ncbi:lysozyme [Streptomyces montanisoli]|uniref:Lysozyme n=1 Tax=Streptomyces montanisoli TaxID=2798581 RepID=A0A940MHF9_9ACTN|nr:lysozyme [Streptomyces montanisoli]MBP0460331.1 lysozyme [Streptomyces montanisoli]